MPESSTISAAELASLREKLLTLPLWERARILAAISAKTGEPIYEVEKFIREGGK